MGTRYSSQSSSGYNSNPPPDDGSISASNQITWAKIKTKLADVLNTWVTNINAAIVTALDQSPTAQSSAYTTLTSDRGKPILVTGTTTISLGTASAMGTDYMVPIVNAGTAVVTVNLATGTDTLNGVANGSVTLNPGAAMTFATNTTPNGYLIVSEANRAESNLSSVSGTNTITATASPKPGAYASGQIFTFIPANTNTGAATLNISSLGAKNIYLNNAALVGGELVQNVPAMLFYDGTQFQLLNNASSSSKVRGYINGFTLSNDGSSPNTVLDIAAGSCIDSANVINITGTAFTKSTAGSWAAGSGSNGMGSGLTIANSTWYHVFAIINNGAFDVYFDTSVSAANKPTNTTAFRRIGSFLTDGSAHIIGFFQYGQHIWWNTSVVDINGAPPSSATLVSLTIPSGVNVRPKISVLYYDGTVGNNYQLWTPGSGSTAKNELLLAAQVSNVYANGSSESLLSNTSRQIYHKTNGANSPNVILYTMGWIDPSLAPIV